MKRILFSMIDYWTSNTSLNVLSKIQAGDKQTEIVITNYICWNALRSKLRVAFFDKVKMTSL